MQPGKLRILIRCKPALQHFRLRMGPALTVEEIIHIRPVCNKAQGTVAVIVIGSKPVLIVIAFLTAQIDPVVCRKHGDHAGIIAVYRGTDFHQRVRLFRKLPAGNLIQFFHRRVSWRLFLMGTGSSVRLCSVLSDSTRFRFLFLYKIVDVGSRAAVTFLCVSLGCLLGSKLKGLVVLLAPTFRPSKD